MAGENWASQPLAQRQQHMQCAVHGLSNLAQPLGPPVATPHKPHRLCQTGTPWHTGPTALVCIEPATGDMRPQPPQVWLTTCAAAVNLWSEVANTGAVAHRKRK